MLKKNLLLTLLMFSCVLSFSQIKGGKITVKSKISNYTLTVNSNIKSYKVYIDGRQIKGNKVTIATGNHSIIVKSTGYTDYKTTINLNRNMVINASLNPIVLNYTLTINSNVQSYKTYIDGRQIKGNKVTIAAGNHSVIVKATDYTDYKTTINLNRNTVINASLNPIIVNYTLSINSNVQPYTTYIDGRQINSNNVILESGNHSIIVKSNGYSDYKTTLNLNKDVTINASLRPSPALVSIFLPSSIINKSMNGAINQIKIYDNGNLLQGFNYELVPGEHTIKIESGGLVIEGDYNFLPGNTYKIEPIMYLNID